MSKFKVLTDEMKDYISRRGKAKKGEKREYTWDEIIEDFNEKWKEEEFTPISLDTFQQWTRKLNPNQQNSNCARVTPNKIKYIRKRMDTDNEKLQEETELTEFQVFVIKDVKRHNFYKGQGHKGSKFKKLTAEEKDWIKEKAKDKEGTWSDVKNEFNDKFSDFEGVTPIVTGTISRWGRKLTSGNGQKKRHKSGRLTSKMKEWLTDKATDKQDSWRSITQAFNDKFSDKSLTPVTDNSIRNWGNKLKNNQEVNHVNNSSNLSTTGSLLGSREARPGVDQYSAYLSARNSRNHSRYPYCQRRSSG